ncbi:hypothetical protein HanRHA438_Chr10g0430661 [Helianthus annuus]|nr:hypothetical protein HanRHA438_Chr10g0430661 [Helianthus annuus]
MAPRKPTCNDATDYTRCNRRYTFPISFGEASAEIRKAAYVGEVGGDLFLPHPLLSATIATTRPWSPFLLGCLLRFAFQIEKKFGVKG